MSKYKILTITGITLFAVILTATALLILGSGPLTPAAGIEKIQKHLDNVVRRNDEVSGIILKLHSPGRSFSETFTSGTVISPDQPFHGASIGKTFTAAMIGRLADRGQLSYSDPVSAYLDESRLENLFVCQGTDYRYEVTIEQLLTHTSGIGDYFEDPVTSGLPFRETMLLEPDRIWTPDELADFTRDRQQAAARPGEKMHYSDTGYILLGLIIEKITGRSFHEQLHRSIFNPLEMDSSYMPFRSEPDNRNTLPPAPLLYRGNDLSRSNILSIDWAGGGIISTAEDLLTFYQTLLGGDLVSPSVLNRMTAFDRQYQKGIYYGEGMMQFRFGEFLFFLESMPHVFGGVGSNGSFMLYDETGDLYIIGSYGSLDFMAGSVRSLITVLNILERMEFQ